MDLQSPVLSKRRAGVCLPLWSLLHEDSLECGDFLTLQRLIPFLKECGFTIVQILPLNDCGYGSSPYSSLSGFAMDPLYISLHWEGISLKNRKKTIATHAINKRRITALKLSALREKFDTDPLKNFTKAEEFIERFSWVKPYLVFKYFYKKYEGMHWLDWEKKEKTVGYSEEFFARLFQDSSIQKEFLWEAWLQYVAFSQLREIRNEYESNGIYLKGDMPILTSGNSCDVWLHRNLYRLDLTAGAPPDAFSAIGQNWGFPVLDWHKVRLENYEIWKEKLQYEENFFHLYRIDHVIGLYRIWAIPRLAKNARYGYFFPQKGISVKDFYTNNLEPESVVNAGIAFEISPGRYVFCWDFHKEPGFLKFSDFEKEKLFSLAFGKIPEEERNWKASGEEILDAFESSTKMIPCAEDLGSVPGFVRDSIHERGLFGIDVIRWTRSLEDGAFIPSKAYRKNAISTLSTHDTSIALDWWMQECSEEVRRELREFFRKEANWKGSAGYQRTLEKSEVKPREDLSLLLDFAFSCRSQFSIQLLSDLLVSEKLQIPDDWHLHRINLPGTPEEKNWKYRYNFYAEELSFDQELVQLLREKIRRYDRI